ncbi:WXG100-like domain-containing protein [Streptomyces decoyicus]
MGVVLPGWADEVLDIIGVSWPNVDEDDYRDMADAMREFADDIDHGADEAHTAIQGLVGSAGGSLAVEALNAHWSKINGTHLKNLGECGRMAATAMDGVAVLIEGAKIGAIVQLGILAAEVIAAQAAAPFTLGLSEVGALAATQATRVIVKRLFKEVCQQVAEQVISIALTPVEEALGAMVGDLVVQIGANALGAKEGVDLGQTAKAGKDGFHQGVQDAKDSAKSAAANPMELLGAGGGSGGGGGGGAGGGFSFDPDEHDRVVTGLQSAGGTFRNKAGGKIGRARSHHGRTRGKDAIADAANAMLDKVIDGIEDGVKKTAKHLDDNMTRGVKQMAKNHQDNDRKLADHFTGIGKGDKKDPKGPGHHGHPPGRHCLVLSLRSPRAPHRQGAAERRHHHCGGADHVHLGRHRSCRGAAQRFRVGWCPGHQLGVGPGRLPCPDPGRPSCRRIRADAGGIRRTVLLHHH